MALNKVQARKHQEAVNLLEKEELSFDEKCFVFEHFHEGGDSNNKIASAHFTPYNLANDLKLDINGYKILDLCAGIGVLSFAYYHGYNHEHMPQLVCVEINPRYVEVGKKLLPEAEWICGDIFDPEIQKQLKGRGFDTAISNPPFGNNAMRGCAAPRYKGKLFEYAVLDIASDLADHGAFIIPQGSSPFLFSGVRFYQDGRRPLPNDINTSQLESNMKKFIPFLETTGINLEAGAGVDTSFHQDDWRGVSPNVEIVTADFSEVRQARKEARIEATATKEITLDDLEKPEYQDFKAKISHAQEVANSLTEYVRTPDFAAMVQSETPIQSQQLSLF